MGQRGEGLAAGRIQSDNGQYAGNAGAFSSDSMRREKRAVAGNSVLAAFLITVLKIVVGLATRSLGILVGGGALRAGFDRGAGHIFFGARIGLSRRMPTTSTAMAR